MVPTSRLFAMVWWAGFTVLGIWTQRFVPGVDFLAPGLILSMQEQGGHRTFGLALAWVLLQEGMGSLPFGYGVAWYGFLAIFYIVGRWLFEARSILFMCLLGIGLGFLHVALSYSLTRLANMSVPMDPIILESVAQALLFPIVWLLMDHFFPRRLRQDVRPL